MRLFTISIQSFRSIDFKKFEFTSPITIFCGKNNAGKTSILEALYFCSSLGTFKSTPSSEIIQTNQKSFKISLNFLQNTINNTIFIEKSIKSSKCTYNDKKISKKNLLLSFPCYSLVFGFNNILLNDSSYRRDFIDSGMFHVEPESHNALSLFQKTLKQRNFMLKSKSLKDIDFWNKEIISANNHVHQLRYHYFNLLETEFTKILDSLKIEMPDIYEEVATIKLAYEKGWMNTFEEALIASSKKDMALGYTTVGTHRSDISIKSKGKLVKESGSMSTLVMACLIIYLAKIRVFHVKHGFKPLLLIDDLFFGIDNKNLDTVIKLLVYSNSNIVMTAPNIYRDLLKDISEQNKKISILNIGDN